MNGEWLREYNRAAMARWRAANPEKARAATARFQSEHPEQVRAWNRKATANWRRANPEAVREGTARHTARRRKATTEPVDYAVVLARWGLHCYLCDLPIVGAYHMDHVVPLAAGGPHSEGNLRPTHPVCNQRKNGRVSAEYVERAS